MKRKRSTLLALVCALILTNTAVVFAASVSKSSDDYAGNVTGYTSSFITESGWGKHRGRSFVTLIGSDREYLTERFDATSSIGKLGKLGGDGWSAIIKSREC